MPNECLFCAAEYDLVQCLSLVSGHRLCSVLPCMAAQESSSLYSRGEGLPTRCIHGPFYLSVRSERTLKYMIVGHRCGGEPYSLHCWDERSFRISSTVFRSVADVALWRDIRRLQESLGAVFGSDSLQAHTDSSGAASALGRLRDV